MHYFDSYSKGFKPEFIEHMKKEIWPISNDELIINQNDFYTDEDPKSYYNFIIKPGLKMNVDYRVVDRNIWKFF